MIASAFPQGSGWAWELLGPDGVVLATGHACDQRQARRMSTRAWLAAGGESSQVLTRQPWGTVRFGGSWGN